MLWFVYKDLKVSETTGALYSFRDLNNTDMKGDDIKEFLIQWDFMMENVASMDAADRSVITDLLRKSYRTTPCWFDAADVVYSAFSQHLWTKQCGHLNVGEL